VRIERFQLHAVGRLVAGEMEGEREADSVTRRSDRLGLRSPLSKKSLDQASSHVSITL
jgi:hypothetical protein